MAVSYKDYYQILGVPRDADEAAIKRAYRAKARELHPDRNKAAGAEAKFRDVNEAYEVLGDAGKRRRYDALGADWRDGAQFTPPPGFEGFEFRPGGFEDLFGGGAGRGGRGGRGASAGGASAGGARFSDFFEALFGGLGGLGGFGGFGGGQARRDAPARDARGGDVEAELELTLADLVSPAPKRIALGIPLDDGSVERRSVAVNIPAGLRAGQRLRLAGQGAPGGGGAPAGDIYLKIRLRAEAGMEADGDDLIVDVDLPAPTAVLGGKVDVPTPDGAVTVRVRAGARGGDRLRVRGRGLAKKGGGRGDLYARVRIVVPEKPSEEEKQLYQRLAELRRG